MNKPFAVAFIAAGTCCWPAGFAHAVGRRDDARVALKRRRQGGICRPFRNLNVTPG